MKRHIKRYNKNIVLYIKEVFINKNKDKINFFFDLNARISGDGKGDGGGSGIGNGECSSHFFRGCYGYGYDRLKNSETISGECGTGFGNSVFNDESGFGSSCDYINDLTNI